MTAHTIIRKDLRFTLDALRPWLVVWLLVAAVISALVLLGTNVRGTGSSAPNLTRLLEEAAALMTLSIGLVTAWITACVLHGDRMHRASLFAAALPIPLRTRRVARALAVAIASIPPVVLAIVAQILRDRWAGQAEYVPDLGTAWWIPVVLAWIGMSWATLSARIAKRIFDTVGVTFVLALAAAALGYLGAWAAFDLAARSTAEWLGWDSAIMYMLREWALAGGAVSGMAVAGTVAALLGSLTRATPGRAEREADAALAIPVASTRSGPPVARTGRTLLLARKSRFNGATQYVLLVLVSLTAGGTSAFLTVSSDSRAAREVDRLRSEELVRSAPAEALAALFLAWNRGESPTYEAEGMSLRFERVSDLLWITRPRGFRAPLTEALASLNRMDSPAAAFTTLSHRSRLGLPDDSLAFQAMVAFPGDAAVLRAAADVLVRAIASRHGLEDFDYSPWARSHLIPDREVAALAASTIELYRRDISGESPHSAAALEAIRRHWQFGLHEIKDLSPSPTRGAR
ncbi:MAG: hypothetical protein JNL80_09575 [Phycisphaerae bacterium]|nr:hypothetical protein [Phycisphaerae bacterium]